MNVFLWLWVAAFAYWIVSFVVWIVKLVQKDGYWTPVINMNVAAVLMLIFNALRKYIG